MHARAKPLEPAITRGERGDRFASAYGSLTDDRHGDAAAMR
jgi:hypothetical protein